MAEYIEKATLLNRVIIPSICSCVQGPTAERLKKFCIDTVNNVSAADVAPAVHGRWVYNPNGMDWNLGAWQCSVCKCNNNNLPGNDKYNPYIFQGSNYCPNCGAKMDGEEHNNV